MVVVQVYKYEELGEVAKQKALKSLSDYYEDPEWWNYSIEVLEENHPDFKVDYDETDFDMKSDYLVLCGKFRGLKRLLEECFPLMREESRSVIEAGLSTFDTDPSQGVNGELGISDIKINYESLASHLEAKGQMDPINWRVTQTWMLLVVAKFEAFLTKKGNQYEKELLDHMKACYEYQRSEENAIEKAEALDLYFLIDGTMAPGAFQVMGG